MDTTYCHWPLMISQWVFVLVKWFLWLSSWKGFRKSLYSLTFQCYCLGDEQSIAGINATFIGTGNPDACVKLLEILVYKVESWKCNPRPCAIGSFYQPTIPPNMTFYAVGAFIHTLTAIKALDSRGVYIPAHGLNKAYEYCRKVVYTVNLYY